ncbi:uncharacterized protein LOC129225977 [Uloborus diversus]|uniref:uncharacterized protein LOC129225977 n=1 Tax=Uloborus diversus TaxID=327109 RepID=UPI002409728D|nr:uncharacterized protein LOC129225977 [Uloborus diversus]
MVVGRGCFAWALLVLLGGAIAADPPFPTLSELEQLMYETKVQVTDVKQQSSALATEYFDEDRQRLEILSLGQRSSVFNYLETNEILEVTESSCAAWLSDESIFDYNEVFYGWLNKQPLRIGPVAALWYAENFTDKIEYKGQEPVRGIKCDVYTLPIKDDKNDMTLTYYFAVTGWTPPYKDAKTRTPVQIHAFGKSSKDSEKPDQMEPIDVITDFVYFKLSISDWSVFQPPLGLGCPLRKATLTMPSIKDSFRYSAEVYDIVKNSKMADRDIEFQQVWYNSFRKMARLDSYTKAGYKSELYDFNTGVTYSSRNWDTCVIQPLRDSMFESYDGKIMGHLKEPEEVIGLEGTFYSMGQRMIRGILCDVFESARPDVTFMGKQMKRLVTTIFFTQEYLEVNTGGETQKQVPMYYMITGWNETSIVYQVQYNVFGFNDITWPQIYQTFRLGRCFPSVNDKTYFVMQFMVSEELARIMESQDAAIQVEVKDQIIKHTGISEIRIPFIRVDYKSTGVFVTGLILDRPPALLQFWFELEWDATTHDPDVKQILTASNKEMCAYACVDEDTFTCSGFFYCQNGCFLKSKDLLEPDGADPEKPVGTKCQEYIRAERNSNNKEQYLGEALLKLEEAVSKKTFGVTVVIDEALKETKNVKADDIEYGNGPNEGGDEKEGPYNVVIDFAKLNEKDPTVDELPSANTLNECYLSCKNSKGLDCASFSYCPDGGDKQCRISSTMISTDEDQNKLAVQDKNCYIYILKFMSYYNEYPGKVITHERDATYDVKNVDECAKKCRLETKFICRGFEYCKGQKTCDLHSKHILDIKDSEIGSVKDKACSHYSARYAADFKNMGHTLLDDDNDKRVEITLEECARACSEERIKNCKSFNYCPPSHPLGTDSSCTFSTGTITDKGAKTRVDAKCRHYEKNKNIEDYGTPEQMPVKKSGYTKKGFTGMVVGMLFLGLFLGGLGFVGYSYFRSRHTDSGMTVRFMKQET